MVDPISIGLAAAGISGSLSLGATSIAFSTIGAYALVGGALVGGSLLLNQLNRPGQQHVDNQLTVKQANVARTRAYGRVLLGGAYFYFAADSYTLYSGYALCEGPVDAIEEHWLNGSVSPIGGLLNGTSSMWPWFNWVYISARLGTLDQPAPPVPGFGPDFQLKGIANTVVSCTVPYNPQKTFTKYFPSGAPSYLARIRAAKVFDPRQPGQSATDPATWTWSANPALCVMDYLTHADGMAVPRGRIDVASFAGMADLCDQAVPLADGTLETRYVLWGTYTFDEEPKAVLERMLKTCDGELYPLATGKIGLRGGQWTSPAVTITPDMILAVQASRGLDKLARFNQLRIRYTDIASQFQQVEGDPWDDTAAQDASGEVVPQDFDAVMVPSYTQARRLAKIFMAKSNPAWLLTITTNLAGLDALGERTVHVTYPDLAIDDDFFVNGFDIGEDGATGKLTLGSLSAEAYTFSPDEEAEGAPPQVIVPPGPYTPPAPAGLTLSLQRTAVDSGTTAAQILASVPAPVDGQLGFHAQYRRAGDAAWIDMVGVDQFSALSGVVADGVQYDVQAALSSFNGTDGPFLADEITIVADATPPDPPSAFTAAAGTGKAILQWRNPGSANFASVRVLRGMTMDVAAATPIATVFGSPNQAMEYDDDGAASGTYSYWLVARNASTVGADPLGPQTVTIL